MNVMRFPLLWLALAGMWLLLAGSVEPGHVLLAAIVASLGCWAVTPIAPAKSRARHPGTIAMLVWLVLRDIVRSNFTVLRLILSRRAPRSAFVEIPLDLTDENGLAILACIVTASPGSAWVQHDSRRSVVIIHVLDTDNESAWAEEFKRTYERRLVEILQQ